MSPQSVASSAFAGFRFSPEVITLVAHWYLLSGSPTVTLKDSWPNLNLAAFEPNLVSASRFTRWKRSPQAQVRRLIFIVCKR